eukprot:5925924-Prymnesium_polylepis.1
MVARWRPGAVSGDTLPCGAHESSYSTYGLWCAVRRCPALRAPMNHPRRILRSAAYNAVF